MPYKQKSWLFESYMKQYVKKIENNGEKQDVQDLTYLMAFKFEKECTVFFDAKTSSAYISKCCMQPNL